MENKGYYRNSIAVVSKQGVEIDKGYLWKMQEYGLLMLEDDDRYITAEFDENVFYEVDRNRFINI
jgi:hypothetical protein